MARTLSTVLLACLILTILNASILAYFVHSSMTQVAVERESILPAIIRLEETINDLRERVDELERVHQQIMLNCSTLSVNCSLLHRDYMKFEETLAQISKRILMEPKDFPDILKDATSKTSMLELILHQIKISKYDQPRVKAEKAIEWVLINLEYIPDDFHEVISHNKIVQAQNYAAFPDEVIDRGGGDCEDLAILIYAILHRSLGESESVYLIALEGIAPYSYRYRLGWAHIAVLYGIGKEFIIIDPAGAYVTGRKYSMRIIFRNDSNDGEESTVFLNPLSLPPQIKNKLMRRGLAELTFTQTTHTESTISDVVYEWIGYWEASVPQIHISFLANSTFYMEFNSTQDFLNYALENI